MQLDQKKYDRQLLCFERWKDTGAKGILEAITGFGKTFVSIIAIKDMNKRHLDRTTIVVVPSNKLKDDWTGYWEEVEGTTEKKWIVGHIEKHGLLNVRVFVVNTYTKFRDWECDLLVLDEVHHYASHDSKQFSLTLGITQYRFILGLSATLNQKEKEFLSEAKLEVFDVIGDQEGERDGYISQSITYNLAIKLTSQDRAYNDKINESFKYYFSKFNHEFNLVRGCNAGANVPVYVKFNSGTAHKKTGAEWRKYVAMNNGYNGDPNHPYSPENVSKYAAQCMGIMKKRKDKWQNLPAKVDVVEQIIRKFNLKGVVFSESAAMADKITERLGKRAVSYHTKLETVAVKDGEETVKSPTTEQKKELRKKGYTILGKTVLLRQALTKFRDKNSGVDTMSVVRALDEGFDEATIDLILMVAYHSTNRQNTQREGRGKRIDYTNLEKRTLIINLYVKDTQEEKWLKAKQKEKRGIVRWVDSIDDININHVISLARPTVNVTI